MNKKYRVITKRMVCCLHGMISLVTLMAVQAATGIDETMPDTIQNEIKADWAAQDQTAGHSTKAQYGQDIQLIANKLPPAYAQELTNDSTLSTYYKACHLRRASRFKNYSGAIQNLLYSRHHDLGGPGVGYLEEMPNDSFVTGMGRFGATGSVSGGGYAPGGALMLLSFQNCYPAPRTLLSDSIGCMRDPCVSPSGNKVVFAWSKDNKGYHIYEMVIGYPDSIRQLTDNPPGLTVSDFDPCYLANGDIIFNSSRCFGATPVGFNITSNPFVMNKDGKYLRRIGFDMAHTFSPSLMADASVMYSRWEFNDRNKYNCLGLFKMNIDGTHQTELYGNQSTWPGALYQGREIPDGAGKILTIIGGYSGSTSNGDLAIISTLVDRNSPSAVKLVAPVRSNPTTFNAISSIADTSRHFQDPYPFDENWFLISYRNNVSTDKFRIYLMNISGDRELLAWDSKQSVSQEQSLSPRTYSVPAPLSNWSMSTARVKILNPYYGMGVDTSVKAGMIKKIRVIGLDYPIDPSFGDVGGNNDTVLTPVSRWGGTRFAKRIIGEQACSLDGSANFYVPPRTPMYFQLIDSLNCLIQTMRSSVTLQPGETWECYGCHENKNASPVPIRPLAMNYTTLLDSFYGMKNVPLHFSKDIQPILTAKCAPCHITSDSGGLSLAGDTVWTGNLSDPVNKYACRFWCKSYLNLTDSAKNLVSVIPNNGPAEGLKPFAYGSGKSKLISKLRAGMHGATLTEAEMAKLCAWIDLGIPHGGKYNDDMLPADSMKYETRLNRRHIHEALETQNIAVFVADSQYKYYTGIEDKNPAIRSLVNKSVLKARYFMAGRQLLVKVPCEGTLSLVDLRGRRLLNATITRRDFLSRPEMSFPLRAPAGLYFLRFKGANLSAEKAIPIL